MLPRAEIIAVWMEKGQSFVQLYVNYGELKKKLLLQAADSGIPVTGYTMHQDTSAKVCSVQPVCAARLYVLYTRLQCSGPFF